MKTISKALVGAVAASAMAAIPVAAASAQSRYDYGTRGISAGDIIAGAVVLGGIAAVAGSLGRGGGYDYRGDDRYYRDGRYGYYNGDPRTAVEQCVNAARQDARNRGYRFAEVNEIRDVKDTSYGWKIRGNMLVEGGDRYGDNRYGNDRYGNGGYYSRGYPGYGNYGNYRGYRDRYDDRYGYGGNRDTGSFTCWIDRGRVTRMDYSGIRGL